VDRRTLAVGWIHTVGILLIVLGMIQCAAAPLILQAPLTLLLPADAHAVLFMYLTTGFVIFFSGMLTLFCIKGFKREEFWAWPLAWRLAIFNLILGLASVVAMLTNPFSHVLLLFAILYMIPLWMYKPEFSPNRREALPTGDPYIKDPDVDWKSELREKRRHT
jgi:hypothetical protein